MDKSKVKDYIEYFSNIMDKKREDVTRQRLQGTKSDGPIRRKRPKSKVVYLGVLTTVRVNGTKDLEPLGQKVLATFFLFFN